MFRFQWRRTPRTLGIASACSANRRLFFEPLEERLALAVNQPPINDVPMEIQHATHDVPFAFSEYRGNRISVSDADAGDSTVRVTLTATAGVVSLVNPNPSGAIDYELGDGFEDSGLPPIYVPL